MATLYTNFTTGDDSDQQINSDYRCGQTFTVNTIHTVSSWKMFVYRRNSITTLTIQLRAVDGSHLPTGAVLSTGTLDVSGVSAEPNPVWIEVTWNTAYQVSAGTEYAVTASIPEADASNNKLFWRIDTGGGYAGGGKLSSSDSGATWTYTAGNECLFEDWGNPVSQTFSGTDVLSLAEIFSPIGNFKKVFSDISSFVETFSFKNSFSQVLSDIISFAETLSFGISNYAVSLIDTLSLNEVFSSITKFKQVFSDTISIVENSFSAIAKYIVQITEALPFNEISSITSRIWTFLTKNTASWTHQSKSTNPTWTHQNKSTSSNWIFKSKP